MAVNRILHTDPMQSRTPKAWQRYARFFEKQERALMRRLADDLHTATADAIINAGWRSGKGNYPFR